MKLAVLALFALCYVAAVTSQMPGADQAASAMAQGFEAAKGMADKGMQAFGRKKRAAAEENPMDKFKDAMEKFGRKKRNTHMKSGMDMMNKSSQMMGRTKREAGSQEVEEPASSEANMDQSVPMTEPETP
jgi:hypothetical protein